MNADDIKALESEANKSALRAADLEWQADQLCHHRSMIGPPDLVIPDRTGAVDGFSVTRELPEAGRIWRDVWAGHSEDLLEMVEARLRARAANYRAGANIQQARLDAVLSAASVAALQGGEHGEP